MNRKWLEAKKEGNLEVSLLKVELDEIHSFIAKKQYDRWLWHAIDHETGTILAFVLGRSEDRMFLTHGSPIFLKVRRNDC